MRKLTWSLASFFLLSIYCLSSLANQGAEHPQVKFDSTNGDFGEVRKGALVSQTFAISNAGTSELRIKNVEFSMPGMNIRVQQSIAPGATAELQITLDTSKYPKDVEAKALLYLNDPQHPEIMLIIKGTVIPPIEFSPMPAFYMSQFRAEEKSRTITIRNNQETDLHITRLEPRGEHFIASFEEQEPGKLYLLRVTVPAETPLGRYRESVIVHTDDPVRQRIHIEVNILVKPDVFLVPLSVDFGLIKLAQLEHNPGLLDLVQQTVIINRRQDSMTIHSVESDISFLTFRTEPENPSQSFRLEVGLEKEHLQPGTFKGNIVVKTSDPEFPELNIPVTVVID